MIVIKTMKAFVCILVILATALAVPAVKKVHPLSKEFINQINNKQSTWKSGKNFEIEELDRVKGLLGVHIDNSKYTLPRKTHFKIHDIPEEFDARTNWPLCKSIGEIRDQSTCGSCWALGAVEAMTDRICISSGGSNTVSVSAGDLLACCPNCGFGCDGGDISYAWKYWVDSGIVTGGGFGTSDGCVSYQFPECDHHVNGTRQPCGDNKPTPKCKSECDDTNLDYSKELTFGATAYHVQGEVDFQAEILENGPIEAFFDVYEDFLNYKSGVYQNLEGDFLGGHAIKILGWGVEDGTPYWLIANSWNEDWGDKGYFKMLRGNDECGIERSGYGGIPKLK